MTKPQVLLVEDSLIALQIEKSILEGLDCRVDCVENGEKVVDMAKKTSYHLILMDIGLPGMNGIQACQAIRQDEINSKKPTVPVVAVTANTDNAQHELCKKVGMKEVVTKPLTEEKAKNLLDDIKIC